LFFFSNRATTHEQIIHRIRHPRHIGRDGLVRPTIAREAFGNYIYAVCLFDLFLK